jgi:hypothetical protein
MFCENSVLSQLIYCMCMIRFCDKFYRMIDDKIIWFLCIDRRLLITPSQSFQITFDQKNYTLINKFKFMQKLDSLIVAYCSTIDMLGSDWIAHIPHHWYKGLGNWNPLDLSHMGAWDVGQPIAVHLVTRSICQSDTGHNYATSRNKDLLERYCYPTSRGSFDAHYCAFAIPWPRQHFQGLWNHTSNPLHHVQVLWKMQISATEDSCSWSQILPLLEILDSR